MSAIELPKEVAARLSAEARRRGVTISELLADTFPEPGVDGERWKPKTLSFIAMGTSTSGRHADEADEMLAEGFGKS